MSDVIHGRNGQTIPIAEYPPGYIDQINDRLNGIQGIEEQEPEGWMDRAAEWVFDNITEGRGFVVIILIAGALMASTIISQIGRLF